MFRRKTAARLLIRFGTFIQSLAVSVMKPKDLISFGKDHYSLKSTIEGWAQKELVDRGLYPEESDILEKIPAKKGELLLLGVGGGRDAVPLIKHGFKVTGVDNVPGMVRRAEKNIQEKGLEFSGLVQDFTELDVKESFYDVIWICSNSMYSGIPTRRWRIRTLERIKKALKTGGFFACQFFIKERPTQTPLAELGRKISAVFTLGNFGYEKGDTLFYNKEFSHIFFSEDEVRAEFEEAGFQIVFLKNFKTGRGGAVLRKPSVS